MNYLYNGVMAPTLPERDEEKYPYVIVGGSNPENPSPGSPIEMHAFFDPTLYQGALFSPYIKCEPSGNYFYAYVYEGEWKVHTPANTDVVSFTDNIRWTNVDLYNPDGTLFLAASDPIPILAPALDPLSLFLGWKAGNWVVRQRGKARKLVGYSYNGYIGSELPALQAGYPYVAIMATYGDNLWAYAMETPMTVRAVGALGTADSILDCKVIRFVVCQLRKKGMVTDNPEWGAVDSVNSIGGDLIWANYDAYKTDGTLYLAASEPVPVYE